MFAARAARVSMRVRQAGVPLLFVNLLSMSSAVFVCCIVSAPLVEAAGAPSQACQRVRRRTKAIHYIGGIILRVRQLQGSCTHRHDRP